MNEIVKKLSISDINFVDTENSSEFFYAEIWLIGAKNNSHHNPISEEVLMKYGNSALGKWVVSDIRNGEATSHTESQKIIGIIPSDSKIRYKRNKDGELFVVADAVLSKIYNVDAWKMFKQHNHREVSCEFLAKEGEPLPNGDIPIEAFDIKGVTILGSYINGIHASCSGAEMTITKFSEEEAEKYYNKFSQETSLKAFAEKRKNKLNKKSKIDSKKEFIENKEEEMADTKEFAVEIGNLWGLIYGCLETKYPDVDYGSIYRIYGIYEEGSQKFAVIYRKDESNKYRLDFSISESGIEMGEDIVEVKENFEEIGEVKRFSEDGDEKFKMFKEQENIVMEEKEDEPEEDEDKDEPKEEEKEMGCHGETAEETKTFSLDAYVDSGAILAFLEKETEQYKELANKVLKEMSAESIVMQFVEMTKELADFKEEKAKAEKEKTDKKLFSIMTPAKENLSVDMFVKLYEEGKALSFSELDAFNNKVKAFVDENKVVVEDKDEIMTFGSNDNNIKEQENIDVFEKLSRKYN